MAIEKIQVNPTTLTVIDKAKLRFSHDSRSGITRKKSGKNWVYFTPNGEKITDEKEIKRINSLAIPPAWTDVWICPTANGYLQATGRDAKGRKQFRYHTQWRQVRDETKFNRMVEFGKALPIIRARVENDLSEPGFTKTKILATIVSLLEKTLIRVGNEEYAKQNRSYGLTTMRDKHVKVSDKEVVFIFTGKSGVKHSIELEDRRLARIIKKSRDLPGYELFQYINEKGEQHSVDSSDVNDYLREITNEDFTAKDFRTWAGTVLAAAALQEFESFDSETQAKKNIVKAIENVSKRLGNTPSVCRKCYIHPEIFNAYLQGEAVKFAQQLVEQEMDNSLKRLKPEEAAVMTLLSKRLTQSEKASRKVG